MGQRGYRAISQYPGQVFHALSGYKLPVDFGPEFNEHMIAPGFSVSSP
jgi:hypothetical protein